MTWRSLLFAPAMRPDVLAKLASRGADAVVIDCEDATAAAAKAEARAHARAAAPALIAAGVAVTVRVNAVASEWFAADVAEALHPGLAAVIVPKVGSLAELDVVAAALDEAGLGSLGVVAGLETALGVADARPLLAHPRVTGAYFGAEDFVADMGGVRTSDNAEVAYARAHVALAGRLAGVAVLDQIVADYGDHQRYRRECAEARALGYSGKLCIHPHQVTLANAAFVPSLDEIERAQRLLAAYDAAAASGVAVVSFEGQMVDEPLAAQARMLLARARPVTI